MCFPFCVQVLAGMVLLLSSHDTVRVMTHLAEKERDSLSARCGTKPSNGLVIEV